MLQGAFERIRHAFRLSVCPRARWLCGCSHHCWPRRHRDCLESSSSPVAAMSASPSGPGAAAAAVADCLCCRSYCSHCCENSCDWLSSLLLSWDWLPIEEFARPPQPPGAPRPSRVSRAGGGNLRRVQEQQGVHGERSGVVGGGRRRGSFGGLEGVAPGGERIGGDRGGGLRRAFSADDSKPLLSEGASMDFREKERRFIKGRFVIPGSEVQRKIAEAMAGMLAAGGRAMSGQTVHEASDGSSSGGGDEHNRTPRAVSSVTAQSGTGDGYGYIQAPDGEANGGTASGTAADANGEASGRSTRAGGGNGGAVLSRRASPQRSASPSKEGFHGAEEGKECVICMEDFTVEDPEMLTLCSCGVNKTFFHYSCLLKWLSKHSYCPACRGYLYFEEQRHRRPEQRSGNLPGDRAGTATRPGGVSSEEYEEALRRALRAGLSGGPAES